MIFIHALLLTKHISLLIVKNTDKLCVAVIGKTGRLSYF